MNHAAQELAAAAAALAQLVSTALHAARRGEHARADRIVAVLRGHGLDGILALLYGMADAVIHANARAAGVHIEPSRVPAPIDVDPQWLNHDGTPSDLIDPLERWCWEFVLARASVDLIRCRDLVDRPPAGGLYPAMCRMASGAGRTVNTLEGHPR